MPSKKATEPAILALRRAHPEEASELTRIAFAAKRYWGYPEELIQLWRDELTLTPAYVRQHLTYVAEANGILGLFVLEDHGAFLELAHVWVEPSHIGKGIGTLLLRKALQLARERGVECVRTVSDPNAEGFYSKLGARRVGRQASKPTGRTLPVLEFVLDTTPA